MTTRKNLLRQAYDSYFEIVAPGWLDDDLVQVDATMPPVTTKEHFQEMLRNLIATRSTLKYDAESKQITGYALVVASGGPGMKDSAEPPSGRQGRRQRATLSAASSYWARWLHDTTSGCRTRS